MRLADALARPRVGPLAEALFGDDAATQWAALLSGLDAAARRPTAGAAAFRLPLADGTPPLDQMKLWTLRLAQVSPSVAVPAGVLYRTGGTRPCGVLFFRDARAEDILLLHPEAIATDFVEEIPPMRQTFVEPAEAAAGGMSTKPAATGPAAAVTPPAPEHDPPAEVVVPPSEFVSTAAAQPVTEIRLGAAATSDESVRSAPSASAPPASAVPEAPAAPMGSAIPEPPAAPVPAATAEPPAVAEAPAVENAPPDRPRVPEPPAVPEALAAPAPAAPSVDASPPAPLPAPPPAHEPAGWGLPLASLLEGS